MNSEEIKTAWHATSRRTNGLRNDLEKVFKSYIKSNNPSFLKRLYNAFCMLVKRPFCRHTCYYVYNITTIDLGGIWDGGVLRYHRYCENCGKKDELDQYCFPDRESRKNRLYRLGINYWRE